MNLQFRFGVLSDPHIGLAQTIRDQKNRFHLVEVSIPALEQVLQQMEAAKVDFLLIPGDLTQHGEPDNHAWLSDRLAQVPFPVYVIPGNHDVPVPCRDGYSIGWSEFPGYYRGYGYGNSDRLYYTCELLPGVRLIALNSNQFDREGVQIGAVDGEQLRWLEAVLADSPAKLHLVMIHHNVIEHLPNQTLHPMGQRYMLRQAETLLQILRAGGVKLVFTGHLHVQDIAEADGIYDITTGSLVSYPHPYRIVQIQTEPCGQIQVQIESDRVKSLPDWPDLLQVSRQWMGDRSASFMTQFLTHPPLNLPLEEAQQFAPHLRDFWSTIAAGDPVFQFPHLPAIVREYLEGFSSAIPRDNQTKILLK